MKPWALLLAVAFAAHADDDRDDLSRAEDALKAAADRLQLVEREYGTTEDPSEILRLRKNFADGETQYLLGEYGNAAALLYDVADSPLFKNEESWPDSLEYLADSLYRQQSWLEARRYYREIIESHLGRFQQEALLRLLELSDKTGDWSGIDEAYRALLAAGGGLKPEVVYVHAKWLARRPDLADADRIARGLQAFAAIPDFSEYGPQARYFEGALQVQKGALDDAVRSFDKVLVLTKEAQAAPEPAEKLQGEAAVRAERAARMARIRDAARLALGRIRFEQGKYGPAIDSYQEIEKESDSYNDALFELAASWLKLGEYEKALRTTELLLVLVEDSPIAPEARLLEANLYLRLKQYLKAQKQFEAISDQYRPVEEKIAALTARDNPVSYYDELLQQGEQSLDTTQLLPEVARKYVSGRDVGHARVIIDELAAGRQGIGESEEILKRLDQAVESGKLDLFPTLQEGNARAVEVENSLLRADGDLATVQGRVVERDAPQLKGALDQARQERVALEGKGSLPENPAQLEERRKEYLGRVAELEKAASRLGLEIESLKAELQAATQWEKSTREKRKADEKAEKEFAAGLERDKAIVAQFEAERQEVLRRLEVARAASPAAASGGKVDDALREQILKAVQKEAQAAQTTAAVLGPEGKALFQRASAAQARIRDLRERAQKVRATIRARATVKLASLRLRIAHERETVAAYAKSASGVEGGTKQLLGRIAYQSFARVGRQFYDLVLKADVGVVDSAWTQKKERTETITAMENEKRGQLKLLQDTFSEVLKEVE